MMIGVSFPQDRCWKITANGKEFYLRDYNDEITGFSAGLRGLAPEAIHYSGNAYYVTGALAQKEGWHVEQMPRNFIPPENGEKE